MTFSSEEERARLEQLDNELGYFRQPEPEAEGIIALQQHKKLTEIHILPIQYRINNFDSLEVGDILCTLRIPYQILKVKVIRGRWNKDNNFRNLENVYVQIVNAKIGEVSGKWLSVEDVENGEYGKLILD